MTPCSVPYYPHERLDRTYITEFHFQPEPLYVVYSRQSYIEISRIDHHPAKPFGLLDKDHAGHKVNAFKTTEHSKFRQDPEFTLTVLRVMTCA